MNKIKDFLLSKWNYILKPRTLKTEDHEEAFLKGYRRFRKRIYLLGALFFPAAIGALVGYRRGYKRLGKGYGVQLHNLSREMRRHIVIGGIIGAVIGLLLLLLVMSLKNMSFEGLIYDAVGLLLTLKNSIASVIIPYALMGLTITFFAWLAFRSFLDDRNSYQNEKNRYGSARFAQDSDLEKYTRKDNPDALESHIYIGTRNGTPYVYKEDGHGLIVAGTRAGKGTNFIMPNLLDKAQFSGSWVVVDPKGESYWYTHQHHRNKGRRVVVINPWGVHELGTDTLNPLDIFAQDPHRESLGNDMRVFAESIVPKSQTRSNASHFQDRARTLVMAMLMHLLIDERYAKRREVATLFGWFSDLEEILNEMTKGNENENSVIVSNHARQFLTLMKTGEREFASIVSTAQNALETFADRELAKTMRSSQADGKPFYLADLSKGNIILYIIIPPENLKTHATWLRLMVSSCLRTVLRHRDKRVAFILDEFYALGYMQDIEVGMGAYAGYGITLIPILQNLTQLREHYPKTWETFIANAGFFNAFALNDNTTTQYISKMAGQTSNVFFERVWRSTPRELITQDEVRRGSAAYIYSIIDKAPLAHFNFLPWYEDTEPIGKDDQGNPIPFSSRGNEARMFG